MSGFFATQRDEAQAYADAAEQGYANSLRPPERPIVGDVFGETQRGLRRAGANIIGSVSAFGETIGRARDRGLLGSGLNPYQAEDEDPGDYWSRFVEGHRETQERAREVREALMPDPETTGYAAEFIGTFVEQIAPSVALGVAGSSLGTAASTTGAVVGMGATGGFATEADMIAQGVDPATAAEAGAISGAILGGSVFLPASMTGRLTTRIASGAAINVPQGMAERAALSGYLRSRGYEEQAARYQWADASQIAIDAVIGGFFGGAFGQRLARRQADGREQEEAAINSETVSAAMVQNDLIHRQLTTAPGVPVSRADEGAHHAALRQAQEQMDNDERVDLSGTGIESAAFLERPDDIEAIASEIEYARSTTRPQTLTQFVRAAGGVSDDRGDLARYAGDLRGFARVLKADGRAIDDMALAAYEAGFFPGADRPTVAEFIDALSDDVNGIRRVVADVAKEAESNNSIEVLNYWSQRGIDTSLKGAALRQAVRDGIPELRINSEDAWGLVQQVLREEGFGEAADELAQANVRASEAGLPPENLMFSLRQRGIGELDDTPILGQGRSKTVFQDPENPARVIVQMLPDPVTEAFLDFARAAHARGADYARHLPNPSALERANGRVRYRTEKLAPNQSSVRVGVEDGRFYLNGLGQEDPQRASILQTMDALRDHLKTATPEGSRYYFDLSAQNFMRRSDGALVINDPVESSGDVRAFMDRVDVAAALVGHFGRSAEQLFSTARVEIVGDASELAAKLGQPVPADAKGVYNSNDGKAYLVARNVSPDEAAGVLLHEVGVHMGMRDMLGEKLFSQLTRELEALTDNAAVKAAYENVDRLIENGQMRPEHRAEEALAYVVETAPDLPLVKRILASLRQWLWRTFEGAQWLGTLSVDDIRMMAVASLRRQAALARREAGRFGESTTDWTGERLYRGGPVNAGMVFLTPDSRMASAYGDVGEYEVRGPIFNALDRLVMYQDQFDALVSEARGSGARGVRYRAQDKGALTPRDQVVMFSPEDVREGQMLFSRSWDDLERLMSDTRRPRSVGRRTPPPNIPDPGTPEYDAALQVARTAQESGQRLTPMQRAILDWEKGGDLMFSLGDRDNDPARQAIADDPSLRIPTENGRTEKAADAMERVEAEQQAAQEMGKGYAAAASCAVQHGIDQAATRAFRTIAAGQGLGAALAIPGAYAVSRGLDAQMASTDFARQRANRERGMRLDDNGFLDVPTQAAPDVSLEAIAKARPYNPPAEGSNDGYQRRADGSIDTPYGAAKSPPAPASFMGGPEDADQ